MASISEAPERIDVLLTLTPEAEVPGPSCSRGLASPEVCDTVIFSRESSEMSFRVPEMQT